jgi:hypothetical protein
MKKVPGRQRGNERRIMNDSCTNSFVVCRMLYLFAEELVGWYREGLVSIVKFLWFH